jgi:hypothetical protein
MEVAFPDPRIVNEYSFYKFIEKETPLILNEIHKKMLKENIYLKPEFKKAIETKLKAGEFRNPHSFINFYGTNFDMIGVSFDRFYYGDDNDYEIKLSFIKDDKLADNQTHSFVIADGKFPFVEFEGMNFFSLTTKNLNHNTFDVIYEDFSVFLSNNLLVFENEEYVSIFESLLATHNLELKNARYIVIKEIALSNNFPADKYKLLEKLEIEYSRKTSFEPFLNCQIVSEFEEKGILLQRYEKTLSNDKQNE